MNEPVLGYAPGSEERNRLLAELSRASSETVEIPLRIGADAVRTSTVAPVRAPHNRSLLLANVAQAGRRDVERAIDAATEARSAWASKTLEERAAVFLRAAELLSGPRRAAINAATMLGQSKTAHQAEIDSACELIDFLRFNVEFAFQMREEQPISGPGHWNRTELRPLDGFVYAVTPFNFTAIAGNLPTAPALFGNTVVWKPSPNGALSNYVLLEVLREAGLPDGVINQVHGDARLITQVALDDARFGGLHFTGSTKVFQDLWTEIGANIRTYAAYPRIVGETGGKDFIVAHRSAALDSLATAIIRGGYEYQGQKCSAASRIYVAQSLWRALREMLIELIGEIRMGDVSDFRNFMGAVIDDRAFDRITGYVEAARADDSCEVVAGGGSDASTGFFVEPTLIHCEDAKHRLMVEEIFGPVVSVFVYDDDRFESVLELCDSSTPYALTGAIFARDRSAIELASDRLRFAAGNFYINDKPTGAVVGQQPFGGSRGSGTNDKAGSALNLWRWVSQRTVKETFVPDVHYGYPSMAGD